MSSLLNFHSLSEARKALHGSQTEAGSALDELKSMRIWICWNYRDKDGRRTKVPVSANGTATGTNEAYRHTWVTFDEAKTAAVEKHYSGVGFVIPKGWFFLDIDHRDMEDPFVKTMLGRFDSYAEKSVSGEGIHIYGKCDFAKIPVEVREGEKAARRLDSRYYLKNPQNGMELYIGGLTNRYAVFTGNMIHDKPLRDCTEAILLTLERDMGREAKESVSLRSPFAGCGNPLPSADGFSDKGIPTSRIKSAPRNDTAEDVVSILRNQKNGAKFCRLYDSGDFSDYGSQSEADLALCTMIAYRTGPNPAAIDNIFRGSALYRQKWERADYRTETIRKAIKGVSMRSPTPPLPKGRGTAERRWRDAGCGNPLPADDGRNDKGIPTSSAESPTPRNDNSNIPYFISQNKEPHVIPPALARYVREHTKYLLVRDSGKQGVLIYVYEHGVYKLYDEKMFKGIIRDCIAEYDEDLVKMHQVNEVYQNILTDRNYIGQNELNAREDIINFQNGLLVVSADDMRLIPHSPQVYSTIQIPCNWTGERSDTPVFIDYLKTLTGGDNMIDRLLLQYMGVCLSNVKGWRMKKSLFLVGDGDTGKSQLKSLTERLLGNGNFIGIDLKEIEARFGTGAIYGTRLAGSSDMSFMTVEELKTFKKITGGDSLFAEFKGQQAFEFTYYGMLWFCMNRLPKFGGDNGKWVYSRIMVVNCPNVIPPDKQDKQLLEKMFAEREGVIYLAVKALQKVIQNGYRFDEPESVISAREQYMAENSTVISFFNECMTERKSEKVRDRCTASVIYDVYKAWCADNNNGYAKTAREFREGICSIIGGEYKDLTVHTKIGTCYRNLTLTKEAKDQYRRVYPGDSAHDDY